MKRQNKSKTKPLKRRHRAKQAVVRYSQPHRDRVKSFPWWKRWLVYITLTIIALAGLHYVAERSFPPVKHPNYGVSFSIKYAEELGVNWKSNFTALLDELNFRNFRLMSYWDDVEPVRGQYNFDDLDWQMNEAAKRDAKVSLSIGMRQPRWPECHKPDWYKDLNKEQQDQALMDYLAATVNHVKDHPALESYQLENEAVNTWFGECTDKDIDKQRLAREFDFVKQLDPTHPVWMSLSDQHGLPLGQPVPDKYGFSVYRVVWNNKTGPFKFYVTYPTPVWYHRMRAWWIETFKHREIFIHELQAEPWGPVATKDLTIDEQDRSMPPEQIRENVEFARRIGKPDIYLWGGEWWYWRKINLRDSTPWDTIKEILLEQQNNSLYK